MFSFAIMMYEVLQRYIMLSAVSVKGTYEVWDALCLQWLCLCFFPPVGTCVHNVVLC